MTRRQALLAVMSVPLGRALAFAQGPDNPTGLAGSNARLRVPLDQWGHLAFSYKGKTVSYSTAEVFAALAKEEK
jgi:hypothetical protein